MRTGLMGAHIRADGKFRARIRIGGKETHLGVFQTAAEAHKAYVNAKREFHAGCTL